MEPVDELSKTPEPLSEHVSRLRNEELESLDRQWQSEQQSHMIADKHGNRYLPSRRIVLTEGIAVVMFGGFWIFIVGRINSTVSSVGAFRYVKYGIAVWGILAGIALVAIWLSHFKKGRAYQEGLERYEKMRSKILQK